MSTDSTSQIESNEAKLRDVLYDLVIRTATDERGVHAPTAIASAARLAGMCLLLSFKFDLRKFEAGQVLLSNEANEKGPELLTVLDTTLSALRVAIDVEKIGDEVPEEHQPHITVRESEEKLAHVFMATAEEFSVDYETMARAAASVAGIIIRDAQTVVEPTIGFSIAAYGFVEGAKTVPPL